MLKKTGIKNLKFPPTVKDRSRRFLTDPPLLQAELLTL